MKARLGIQLLADADVPRREQAIDEAEPPLPRDRDFQARSWPIERRAATGAALGPKGPGGAALRPAVSKIFFMRGAPDL